MRIKVDFDIHINIDINTNTLSNNGFPSTMLSLGIGTCVSSSAVD